MTRFLDGPAAGVSLSLRRAPKLLRAVFSPLRANWDALDQLTDTPRADETVHVYRLKGGSLEKIHFYGVRHGRRGGWDEVYAEYEHHPEQPPQETLRDTAAWREWAAAQAAKETG